MGLLTLAQLKTEIREGFGGTVEYDARLNSLLTMAQDRLVSRHDFEELKVRATLGTTADSGDASADMVIALPTTLRQLYSVVLIDGSNSRKLEPLPAALWDERIPYAEQYTRGKPTNYRIWGTNIELWRVPDAAYTLRGHYSTYATALSSESQTSDLVRKDQLLILLVQIWLAALMDRSDRANYFWSMFRTIYEESLGVSIYKADVNKAGTMDSGETGEYWKNPFVSGMP